MAKIEGRGMVFGDFDAYLAWAREQVCIDCGAKASEKGGDSWVTETQCSPCWKKYGAPDNRGKSVPEASTGNG